MTTDFMQQTKTLIDELKAVCANYGLGNDGNEFKIITQVFLYKFINDKFAYELKQVDEDLKNAANWEQTLEKMTDDGYEMLTYLLPAGTAVLHRDHLISYLFGKQNEPEFAKRFDDTLAAIAAIKSNYDLLSVKTETGHKLILFDRLSQFVADISKRDAFCRSILNKLVNFSFEHIFTQRFDFFATIFEYLIKDYNKDSGGKYAEYYTPHAVAKIMAAILVDEEVYDVTCYDPASGSGTLLMNLAHKIGENRCTIFSQDISQKSTGMLRLNLVLNNLAHSIQNIVQGNTLLTPYHRDEEGALRKFDFIVSNPPFKLDFSDDRNTLDSKQNSERFFAGIAKIPNKDKDKMAIYPLFIQHIMYSLSKTGRAAIVVPTGFITVQSGIEYRIREALAERRMLRGVISMPSNIFASTGTNVSILFLDAANKRGEIVLMDASKLGTTVKDGKNQKTLLSHEEEDYIIHTFNQHEAVDDFSVVVSYEQLKDKNYSLSAGQYFDVKIDYTDITVDEFNEKIAGFNSRLDSLFVESDELGKEIKKQLGGLVYA